jgi:predicted O-methyltransferase YrrM
MRAFVKRLSLWAFRTGQRLGVSIVPNHYYVPLADVGSLRARRSEWARPSAMLGLEVDLGAQVEALRSMVLPYRAEYEANGAYLDGVAREAGPGFGPLEAQALHGVLRHLKPRTVIEVGSGVSTYCILRATEEHPPRLTCIEPYPSDFLRASGVELLERRVESLDPTFFDRLESGDLLFIDSSHAVRPAGDVLYLYLEVLPRLKPGVHIHVHDIFLPYHYNRDVLFTYMQWVETGLLQALLVNNRRMRILFSMSMLHYGQPESLAAVFPGYRPQTDHDGLVESGSTTGHFPSSTFLVTV